MGLMSPEPEQGACGKLRAPCDSLLKQRSVNLKPLLNVEIGFVPKLVSTLREGYNASALRADAIAGLTVAIVALPLSMAIAIASHVSPDKGLYTAIVGGFFISLLGGSRFQIGGPAGAFIVLIASIVDRYGFEGLQLATLMAGVLIFVVGALRLGAYIKYVPHPVTVGFTAGIAIIIFTSQIRELFGLNVSGTEPAEFVPKLRVLWQAIPTFNLSALLIAAITIAIIIFVRKFKPSWPAFLVAVTVASVITTIFHLNVVTIASKFGGIPSSLPAPHLPAYSFDLMVKLLPDVLAITFLGSIESLLSAVVADSMTGRQHRSNIELMAQGVANVACAIFGGIVATGTIARTATNVRAGAHGPISGVLHSVFLLLFMVLAAPLAGYIPLAALAGILTVVCWGMADKAEFKAMLKASHSVTLVFVSTLVLTILVDLTTGIIVGLVLAWLVHIYQKTKDSDQFQP